jgi:uncharacterized protein with GYD domain
MPIYITLFNVTEQGIKNIKDAPKRIEAAIKAGESIGGKLIGFYATMVNMTMFPFAKLRVMNSI